MKMDKKMALLALVCGSLFSATCSAVNIDITGTVVASPCVVNNGNESLEVPLGDNIQANELAVAQSTTAWKNFTLALTSCPPATTSFSVAFAGTADDDANYYKNNGTATNLKLELTSQDGSKTINNGAVLENVAISSSHTYDLLLRARAVSKGLVMPGTIQSQVQATFTYQ